MEEKAMKNKFSAKVISVFLAVLMAVTGLLPATVAFAADGVEGYYDLQIFYDETDTIVPTYEEDGTTEYKEYMFEGDELQLKYKLIDSTFPDNGYVKWYSEAPALADVDQTGKVKAFDSSKGAVIHLWIDNEIKTIPLVGGAIASGVEKVFFNEYVNLDSMDTDEIIALAEKALGSDSWIADNVESYKGDLIDSLRTYLDKVNSNIHCELYDKDGKKVADDVIKIVVKKNEEWYAQFLPNGTHITNKSQVPTTVAKGSTVQLYAITTPQRLHFGTVYSVKSSSIFTQGRVVATVDDSGLVSFKNTGTATIMASPDSEDVVNAILKFINYFYTLENTGTLDTQKAADILIKYIGIDINRNVLAGILDAAFAISKIAGDTADPVQLTATAVELIANIALQFAYNDTITFTVVDAQPIEKFEIGGVTTVKEGSKIQLVPENIEPTTGDVSDIVWSSSNPNIAMIDEKTGVITGLDAGGSLGALSSQTVEITAVSTTRNIERKVTVTVTGKTGKYISYAAINGNSLVDIEGSEDYTYSVFPKRVSESENLYTKWGIVTGKDEDGNPTYAWASKTEEAVDVHGVGKIDANGHFTPLSGGKCTLAFEAKTGYLLSDGTFYEISSFIATKEIETGIPVESIHIGVSGAIGNGSQLGRRQTVNINGVNYDYTTVHIGVGNMYYNHGATVKADVYPANATNQNVTWVVDNGNYNKSITTDTHSIDVTKKAGVEYTDTFNIYAVSNDGEIISNVVTVCITRNYASSNTINEKSIEMINGKTAEATHSLTFEGTWESGAYACYDANWYSSDEEIFTVKNKGNDNSDAVLTAHDVGTATLYCVSADGAFMDSIQVTVKPDKQELEELVNLCDSTIVLKTKYNKDAYKTYMKKLDAAYIVLYEQDMASQTVVDTTASSLLGAFIAVGGFVGVNGIEVLDHARNPLKSDYVTVEVGTAKNYKNYSYDFEYKVLPAGAMYSKPVWTSSNSSVIVDENGVCTPASNDPCSADITCTITDYNGNSVSETKHIAFAKTVATGVEIKTPEIKGALIGTEQQLEAVVLPKNVFGNSTASVKDVTWYSTNEDVVTVDEKGKLTFVYGGDAYVVCTTADGGFTASCRVNVTTNYDNLELLVKQLDDISLNEVSYYPETWKPYIDAKNEARDILANRTASQEEVDAQYDKLQAAYNGLKKYVDIQKVELYLDGEPTAEFYQYDLRLLKEGISYKNATLNLNVRLYPNNATYQSATWVSSTSDISVTNEGICSPTVNKSCYGRITCTVVDSFGKEFSDDVWVSFSYNPVTEVQLSQDSISGAIGTQYQMTVTIQPVGSSLLHIAAADIRDYYWESDDESVATVDSTGLVTFTGAGSTTIRCVSYDGGVSGECKVSSEGDRTALKESIDVYGNLDYTQYEYVYGSAYVKALEDANRVLTDKTCTQDEIDYVTSRLNTTAKEMLEHPDVKVESISVKYQTQKRNLTNDITPVASGTIGSNNAISVNLSNGYSNYNDYNDVILTASCSPSNAKYKSVTWEIAENSNMSITVALAKITLHPTDKARTQPAYARVKAVYTDYYGSRAEREIWVVMGDQTCTGITVNESNVVMKGTDEPYQLHYGTTGSASGYVDRVYFTSSDDSIASVSSDGLITPLDNGEVTITAKTLDGGYTKYIKVTIQTDFSKLAAAVEKYGTLINNIQDTDQFTEESLNALTEQVNASKAMVDEGKASQAEVNEALRKLNAAYSNLTGYIPATGISLSLVDGQDIPVEVNPGFIRYQNNSLNNAAVRLKYDIQPANGMYDKVECTSSSSLVTVEDVSANGSHECVVTNMNALPQAAEINVKITTVYGDSYTATVYVSFVRYAVKTISFNEDKVFGAPDEVKPVPVGLTSDATVSVGSRTIPPSVENCLYESKDESIATVDGEGNVTFRKKGKTSIVVTTIDGGLKAEIPVITTSDTTALQQAIAQAEALDYMDYAYDYGIALRDATQAAKAVYANLDATQAEVDIACTALQTAINELEGNEYETPVITLTSGDKVLQNNGTYEAEKGALNVDVSVTGMYKSVMLSALNENNVTVIKGDSSFALTKTGDNATVTLKVQVFDDYNREIDAEYNITLSDKIIPIEEIGITLDGVEVESVTKSGYKLAYRDFEEFKLGYVVKTPNASAPTSVVFTASDQTYITVSEDGVIGLTTRGKGSGTNTTNVTCTVTNTDGTTVSKKIPVTIKLTA